MLLCATVAFFAAFISKFSFGVVGENVTIKMRNDLYSSILRKDIGWFDNKENAPGVLSSTMASEAQVINGVSSEGLATQIEATCSLLVSIGIGFYFYWQESLVCFACVPFLIFGSMMNAKFQQGLSSETSESYKEADLLSGDAITNYRTVASFGQER